MTRCKILLVEDYAPSAEMVRRQLEREGFDVVVAVDGPSGEATVTTHMSNLRAKLGADGAAIIRTVRGVGRASL